MRYISKEDLEDWLEFVSKTRTLYAPLLDDSVLLYQPTDNIDDIVWEYTLPKKSVKEILIPQTEKILTIEKDRDTIKLTENTRKQSSVIFGVRSCDARGCLVLDQLLLENGPVDRNYQVRRQNTVMVGVACKEMGESCFCTSVGGAPDDSSGLDVMLHADQEGYLVEYVSETGEQLFEGFTEEIKGREVNRLDLWAEYSVPDQEILKSSFNSPLWEAQSERCLSCRICAYVCPTCRCFDVRDEQTASNNGVEIIERIRCWDSCSWEAYRRISGGHNPREAKSDRLRNRIYCKLHYVQEQYGRMACTGCGRCRDACPVSIDITEIMGLMLEGEPV
jgi:ferredoxin